MSNVDNPNAKDGGRNPKTNPEADLESLAVGEVGEPTPDATPNDSASDLPDKYKGKTVADVARMHQELEQKFGQQGNEVGELRRTLDQYILSRLQDGTQNGKPDDDDDDDFFDDPKASVKKAIAKDPEIQKLKQSAQKAERAAIASQLRTLHSDYESLLKDGEFQNWVKGSKLRQRMLVEADRNYDVEVADELFSEFKAMRAAKSNASETVNAERQQRQQDIKRASTGTARGANTAPRSSEKIYRRADIVELMKNDPRRYESLMPEIRRAYEEGRVR